MKKLIVLVLVTVCVLGLVGCDHNNRQAQEKKEAKKHTAEVTENYVGEIGRGALKLSVEISDEDASVLTLIVNRGTWNEEPADCENDCVINLKGQLMYYNSENGTLNKYSLVDMSTYSSKEQDISGESLVLSEDDRKTVNAILEKYITLGLDSN